VRISKELERAAKDVSQDLRALERAYMVARAGQDKRGNVLWMHRDVERKASKAFGRNLIKRHLAYFGPLTADEIAYDLGLAKETVTSINTWMEEKGILVSGAFTEPSLQFMLSQDRAELKDRRNEGIVSNSHIEEYHLKKHFGRFDTLDEYFDKYGVVWMPQDLMARSGPGLLKEWRERRKNGDILHGRFLDGSVCFVRKKEMPGFVNAYRSGTPTTLAKQILRIIERKPGIDITGIAKEAELPSGILKPIVEELDRNMYVIRQYVEREGWSSWNHYELLNAKHNSKRSESAKDKIILQTLRSHGPIPLRSLAYATGFSINHVKDLLDGWLKEGSVKEIKTAEDNRTLYISGDEVNELMEKEEGDNPLRILTLYDPFVQHYRFELRRRFGDAWYFPIFQGSKLVGTMEMWEMSGCMDIRDLTLEDSDLLAEFLDNLDEFAGFYAENYMDVIRVRGIFGKSIEELEPKFVKLFEEKGYKKVNEWLVKGNVMTFSISEEKLFSYLLWKQHILRERNFDGMEDGLETMSGFRSDEEAFLRCGRTVPLKRLHKTGIVEMGQLIPKLIAFALPDDILLFKAALGTEPDEYMKILMAMFKEEGVMKWREVLDKSPLGYRNTLAVKAKLTSALIILRDPSNQFYITEETPYKKAEARKEIIRKMFDQFGVFSAEHLGLYTKGEYRMPEIRRLLRDLEDEGALVKGYLLEGSEKLHWMVKEDVLQVQKEPVRDEVLITSNDRLAMYLLPWVRQKFGIGSSWILLSNGEMTAVAKVRKKKLELFVGEVFGDDRVKGAIKEYSIRVGKRLRQAEVAESEDYQEWYERHMLPQK